MRGEEIGEGFRQEFRERAGVRHEPHMPFQALCEIAELAAHMLDLLQDDLRVAGEGPPGGRERHAAPVAIQ